MTSVSNDEGELSPWVTWPSLHRGMNNTEHNVLNLGQDVKSFKGTPIWEEYRKLGLSIGLMGPLQSWPPQNPGELGFYVPDTFAHDESCLPASLGPLQKFNLSQVKQNGRVVSASVGMKPLEALALFRVMLGAGVRLGTFWEIFVQLIRERRDSKYRARRPMFQTILFWDVFRKFYSRSLRTILQGILIFR